MDIGTKEVIMTAPSASNPKRLSDYSFGYRGRGQDPKTKFRRDTVKSGRVSGPTDSEREADSRAKYKEFVQKDIAASERRRKALETMWQVEKNQEMAARKQAVEECNAYAAGAPDPKKDITGELRAAYFNTPLGKTVTDNLTAHIQYSMNKNKGLQTPEQVAKEGKLKVAPAKGDKRHPGDRGTQVEENRVDKKYAGYGYKPVKAPATKKEIEQAPDLPKGGFKMKTKDGKMVTTTIVPNPDTPAAPGMVWVFIHPPGQKPRKLQAPMARVQEATKGKTYELGSDPVSEATI
jgi:hypothetical protein